MEYDKVQKYLKEYRSTEPSYDPNGALHLLKSSIENLQTFITEVELEQYASCLDEKDEAFLNKLLEAIPLSREINKDIY